MQPPSLSKFGFRIRTRNGAVVEQLFINGRDEEEARRRLQQMYHQCQVLSCWRVQAAGPSVHASFEDVVDLLSG